VRAILHPVHPHGNAASAFSLHQPRGHALRDWGVVALLLLTLAAFAAQVIMP
jgi:hypothetical protein